MVKKFKKGNHYIDARGAIWVCEGCRPQRGKVNLRKIEDKCYVALDEPTMARLLTPHTPEVPE